MRSLSALIIIILLNSVSLPINGQNRCELKSNPDGTFLPVQCKGEPSNGRCYCYSESGSRIFGWSWWSSSENMTCACSRERDRLSTKFKRRDVSLHCAENGNYDELQCDNGMCWCVEEASGRPIERLYPSSMMKYLPCYSESKSLKYLRQCESKALGSRAVLDKLETHGTFNTHIETVLCDDDGSYRSYRLDKNFVNCAWKDSKRIGNYQSSILDLLQVNCNCARDEIIYAEENLELSISCQPNGNYASNQASNGRPYCVDSDGCATTDLGDIGENMKCS